MADKRKQENIRRDRRRRGAGLEMAMLLMLVAVALSGLLTSVTIMQVDRQKDSEEHLELLEQRMVLDQIGRDFCSQRAAYELPEGVDGYIVCEYNTEDGKCPGCCADCTVCNPVVDEGTVAAETGEDTGDTEGEDSSGCCADCAECGTGCTGYTEISLVVYSDSDSGEVVLTVVLEKLANNQDGTYTVTKWSYGE